MHLDLDDAVALAGLATPALDVEGEAAGRIAAGLGLGEAGEPVADRGEGAGIGGGVRPRRPPDRRLVDVDDLVEMLQPIEPLEGGRGLAGAVQPPRHRLVKRVDEKRRLAAAGDAGNRGEGAERNLHRDVLKVVAGGAHERQRPPPLRAPPFGHGDREGAAEVAPGERAGVGDDLVRRSLGDDLAAVDAGGRADVHDMVGAADRVLVMLDDEHGVAEVAKVPERLEEARIVLLMEADRRFVEDVEDAGEARADLRGEADALALAARKRAGLP